MLDLGGEPLLPAGVAIQLLSMALALLAIVELHTRLLDEQCFCGTLNSAASALGAAAAATAAAAPPLLMRLFVSVRAENEGFASTQEFVLAENFGSLNADADHDAAKTPTQMLLPRRSRRPGRSTPLRRTCGSLQAYAHGRCLGVFVPLPEAAQVQTPSARRGRGRWVADAICATHASLRAVMADALLLRPAQCGALRALQGAAAAMRDTVVCANYPPSRRT